MNFKLISDIDVNRTESWQNSCFLTIDVDWASDDVLLDTINIIEASDVPATWFITHDTVLLKRLSANPKFELGIHPNFNYLLCGESTNGRNAEEVLDRILTIVPNAQSVRSHSMTQSAILQDIFHKKGLLFDLNCFIPEQSYLSLKPWKLWNNLTIVPYFWEDNLACMYSQNSPIEQLTQREGLKVFDFHPIHIFLNTENLERYEKARPFQRSAKDLAQFKNTQRAGTRTALEYLLRCTK